MSRTPAAALRSAAVPRHRLAVVAAMSALALAGCSSGAESSNGAAGGDESAAEVGAPDAALPESAAFDGDGGGDAGGDLAAARNDVTDDAPGPTDPTVEPAVIQTGSITVESDDVGRARFELGKVVDSHDGSIADEKTTASSEGEVRLSGSSCGCRAATSTRP